MEKLIDHVYRKEEYDKLSEAFHDSSVICKCGHPQAISPNKEKGICSWCKRTIYNNSKARLRYLIFKQQNNKE